jgi:hypothetical protein
MYSYSYPLMKEYLFNFSSHWEIEPLIRLRRYLGCYLPETHVHVCVCVCVCVYKNLEASLVDLSRTQVQNDRICFDFEFKQNRPSLSTS